MERPSLVLILAHGILGWGEDSSDAQMRDYYKGVEPFLLEEFGARLDLRIHAPTVPPSDSVEGRGERLRAVILGILYDYPPETRVHIIAHSMGGLDSRWVLIQPGMADRIASLTTIATPHRGTTLGTLAHKELPLILPAAKFLQKLWRLRRAIWRRLPFTSKASNDSLALYHKLLGHLLGTDRRKVRAGLYALTLKGAKAFNRRYEAAERSIRTRTVNPVAYVAYGGIVRPHQTFPLKVTHDVVAVFGTEVEKREGNDGAVSVWSARFPWDDEGRHYKETVPFDHFMQINWKIPEPRPGISTMPDGLKACYRNIMDDILRVQGLQ